MHTIILTYKQQQTTKRPHIYTLPRWTPAEYIHTIYCISAFATKQYIEQYVAALATNAYIPYTNNVYAPACMCLAAHR